MRGGIVMALMSGVVSSMREEEIYLVIGNEGGKVEELEVEEVRDKK